MKNMKNILMIFICFASINLFGQNVNKDNKTEYGSNSLVSSKEKLVTSFIGFDGQFNNFTDPNFNLFKKNTWNFQDPTMSAGITLGSTIDRAFTIGVMFRGTLESTFAWYTGILLEPTLFSKFPIHLTFPCIAAWGDAPVGNPEIEDITHNSFFMISGSTRLELNIANGVRLSCGPSWRYIPTKDIIKSPVISKLSYPSFEFSIKIGGY